MTWATDRLDALKAGTATPPPIVETLKLGLIDDWGEGWVRKSWRPTPELATADGSLFGGYLAALADQVLAFAAMTVVPHDRLYRTVNLQLNLLKVARDGPLAIEVRGGQDPPTDHRPRRIPSRRRHADRRRHGPADRHDLRALAGGAGGR